MGNHVKPVGDNRSPQDVTNTKSPSSASDNSGDTLQDSTDGDYDATYSSPPSVDTLNFNSLSMTENSSPYFKSGYSHYDNPYQRGLKTNDDFNKYGQALYRPIQTNRNFHLGNAFSSRPRGRSGGGVGARNSHTWISPEAQAHSDFMVIRNSMRRLFKNAEVSKWKLNDYIAHREAMAIAEANRLAHKVKMKEEAPMLHDLTISPEVQNTLRKWGLSHGNFDQHGNYGRILGEQTIWCLDWMSGKDEIAPWPTDSEMKWEGDDRAKTGVGRFLPLPREEGPPGIPWNQLPVVEQYPLDMTARIPTMEDIYLPVDEIDDDVKYNLINKDLDQAIDALLKI